MFRDEGKKLSCTISATYTYRTSNISKKSVAQCESKSELKNPSPSQI